MKTKRTLTIVTVLVALAALMTLGFAETRSARAEASHLNSPSRKPLSMPLATSTPNYTVAPSNTDGEANDNGDVFPRLDCPGPGIGCENEWGEDALNIEHLLYLPPQLTETGKLLIFLGGGNGGSTGGMDIAPVATQQGYHFIALTYPAARANDCSQETPRENALKCFGNAFREVVTGVNGPDPGGDRTTVGLHPQDSIKNRILKVLQWAKANHFSDGWGRFLTDDGLAVDWSKIHLAGMSNGSSHGGLMGTLNEFREVGRVALFAGPDDGDGGHDEETRSPALYIQEPEVPTGARYFGLVHVLNKAPDNDHSLVFRVTKDWVTYGMEDPPNSPRVEFDPEPGVTPNFGNSHMLISINPTTNYLEAHESVIRGRECSLFGDDNDGKHTCLEYEGASIGYEPAWRCILGPGDDYANDQPNADAGPDQVVECAGGGGAFVTLDGSLSSDPDCDIVSYTWTGPFGTTTGRKPTVFMPLGTNSVTLVVRDTLRDSDPRQVLLTVQDTQPPSLHVALTPTELWPANHTMVRIDAIVSSSDSCGPTPQVVLTSITSDQPDNGNGDGDTADDVQDAAFGTFDRSFLLRAERAGNDQRGRTYIVTYTAIDASGNCTQVSATVHVPHSQPKN